MEQKHNFEAPKEDPKSGNTAASKLTGATPPVQKDQDLHALNKKDIPNREPATDEESPEGKLTGVANADNSVADTLVGGAQKGKANGETWENDKASKARHESKTSTWTEETSGSTAQDPKVDKDKKKKDDQTDEYSTWHV
jgi:hypothetical protein